jgi:hypothetical protein
MSSEAAPGNTVTAAEAPVRAPAATTVSASTTVSSSASAAMLCPSRGGQQSYTYNRLQKPAVHNTIIAPLRKSKCQIFDDLVPDRFQHCRRELRGSAKRGRLTVFLVSLLYCCATHQKP